MVDSSLDIVILGLSITSSWGNGHATTYRGLVRELAGRGHDVLFLERDMPWYAENRDLPRPPYGEMRLYDSLKGLRSEYRNRVARADLVIVGSYVPDGIEVGKWTQETARGVTAFYDIDTPVTLAKLEAGDDEYISEELIPGYDIYLSFCGGPTLSHLEDRYGSPMARPLYCSADVDNYRPIDSPTRWQMGYLGTYSDDRQPRVQALLNEPAQAMTDSSFVVAGPRYPDSIRWPKNVERIEHLPPAEHAAFYNAQRFTLNVTRDDMIEAGYSPSIRLFEAAACETVIISDRWDGIESIFTPGEEILIADDCEDVLRFMSELGDKTCRTIARAAREKVLSQHTALHRAQELESHFAECLRT